MSDTIVLEISVAVRSGYDVLEALLQTLEGDSARAVVELRLPVALESSGAGAPPTDAEEGRPSGEGTGRSDARPDPDPAHRFPRFDGTLILAPPQGPRPPAGRPVLTEREFQVLKLSAEGMSAEDMARRLSLSVGTVKRHLESIFEKTGCRSRVAAVTWAFRRGLLE
jgi:DNA-binding CsgD family transcriptional regulator